MSRTGFSMAAALLLFPSVVLAQNGSQPASDPPRAASDARGAGVGVGVGVGVGAHDAATSGAVDTSTAVAVSAAFRAAAQRTLPAVVFIAVEQAPVATRTDQAPAPYMPAPIQPAPRQGTGSGVIIDAQGHILTNNHVVADASRLTVKLVDGREYSARLVGSDVSTDIAVIRIEPRDGEALPVAELGDSESLRVGDWVLALGNPLGLTFTVTAGIVSAKGRQITSGGGPTLESFIQTDAVINPGNSGGPLIDLLGRVVGINSAIFGSDRFVGYGFAVPISLARRVVADLLEYGYLRRPRLGVAITGVTAVEVELFRLPEVSGALITNVEAGQAADRGGIRLGDVVVSLNNVPISDDADLITRLASLQPGQQVTFGIIREARRQDVAVTLGEFAREETPRTTPAPPRADSPDQVLGFTLTDLTPEFALRAGYRGEGGVMVRSTVPFSGAWRSGLRDGAIILAVNGQRVRNAGQARDIARDIRAGAAVALTVFDAQRGEVLVTYRTTQ